MTENEGILSDEPMTDRCHTLPKLLVTRVLGVTLELDLMHINQFSVCIVHTLGALVEDQAPTQDYVDKLGSGPLCLKQCIGFKFLHRKETKSNQEKIGDILYLRPR